MLSARRSASQHTRQEKLHIFKHFICDINKNKHINISYKSPLFSFVYCLKLIILYMCTNHQNLFNIHVDFHHTPCEIPMLSLIFETLTLSTSVMKCQHCQTSSLSNIIYISNIISIQPRLKSLDKTG